MKSVEVGTLKAVVIAIQRPHHAGPRSTKHEVTLALTLYHVTILVEKLRLYAEKWVTLQE
jgi:hypothetical protein